MSIQAGLRAGEGGSSPGLSITIRPGNRWAAPSDESIWFDVPYRESCASGFVLDHWMGLEGKKGRRCPLSPTCARIRTVGGYPFGEFSGSDAAIRCDTPRRIGRLLCSR